MCVVIARLYILVVFLRRRSRVWVVKEERTVTEGNVGNRCRSQVPQEKRKVYKKAKKEVLLKEMLSLTEEEVLRASMKKRISMEYSRGNMSSAINEQIA